MKSCLSYHARLMPELLIKVDTLSNEVNQLRPVDKLIYFDRIPFKLLAEVAELADALRSGRSEHYAHEGSNPSFGTPQMIKIIK